MSTKHIFEPEYKQAWDDVLFWAKRLSYRAADYHPEWRENYLKAKAHLKELQELRELKKQTVIERN